MGSRYMFILFYCLIEKLLTKDDYKKVDKFKLISQSSFWDIKTTILTFLLIQFVSFPSYRLDYENWVPI